MNGIITQVRNRRSSRQVEIIYQDENGQQASIALAPEKIVDLHLQNEQMQAKLRQYQQDQHYAFQNAKLLQDLMDYVDIISECDFSEMFPDDPEGFKRDWADWLHRYTQQRKARTHFFVRKGEQS